MRVHGLVVNRIHPEFGSEDAGALRARSAALTADGAHQLRELYENLADFVDLAKRERGHLDGLERSVGKVPVVRVPLLGVEVCDIASLGEVGRYLLAPASDGHPGAD